MRSEKSSHAFASFASILILLAIWKIAALLIQSPIILPPPERVGTEILSLLGSGKFFAALGATFSRGILGFGLSAVSGVLIGLIAGISPTFRAFIRPFMTIIRATPVLAIILIALVWFSADLVPVFSAFLMAFPVVSGNIVEGIANIDEKLLEMASTYGFKRKTKIFRIFLPGVLPYFIAGASNALGLTWKVVVAGEVLSQPLRAIGTGMQNARIQLETAQTFAWAFSAIFLCAATEFLFKALMKRIPK